MRLLLYALQAVSVFYLYGLAHGAPDVSQFVVRSLPDGPALPPSWAGRLAVPHTEPGNSLFFWLFETEDPTYDDNLIIWLSGGPGCSSLSGLATGNGPISFEGGSTRLVANPYSWTRLEHVLYIDQPVGTGYATASEPYLAVDNDRVTTHFYDWLQSLFLHFPHLQSKQVHLVGESWAGIYIPYFASAILDNQDSFPINIRSVTLGDPSIGNPAASSTVTVGKFLESNQQLLQLPDDILAVFMEADETCGFNNVLQQAGQYPPEGKIYIPGNPEDLNYRHRRMRRDLVDIAIGACNSYPTKPEEVRSSIFNNACSWACATFSTALDYLNTTSYSGVGKPCFDRYDISNDCSTIYPQPLLESYFSRADVQTTLNLLPPPSATDADGSSSASAHQPQPAQFTACNRTIMFILSSNNVPAPPAYSLLPTLVTSHNVSLHIYHGEYDMLTNHYGIELTLQNMTWNGAQGFSQPISRPFYPDNPAPAYSVFPSPHTSTNASPKNHNKNQPHSRHSSPSPSPSPSPSFESARSKKTAGICPAPIPEPGPEKEEEEEAGIWVSERGVTYHLFWGAGHSVIASKPREMFAYMRDVVVAGIER
ncbi:Alpha/Beta hydrolase protein [Aspergillus egyptiacus]|nr:Alpha/Beta hydrolase protein [Aspergillus egyptiacus]